MISSCTIVKTTFIILFSLLMRLINCSNFYVTGLADKNLFQKISLHFFRDFSHIAWGQNSLQQPTYDGIILDQHNVSGLCAQGSIYLCCKEEILAIFISYHRHRTVCKDDLLNLQMLHVWFNKYFKYRMTFFNWIVRAATRGWTRHPCVQYLIYHAK